MQVILLERVAKLGQMGEVVKVKDGFARNYLLPQGKALRASEANIATFEARKAELATRNDLQRALAWRARDTTNAAWAARYAPIDTDHTHDAVCAASSPPACAA